MAHGRGGFQGGEGGRWLQGCYGGIDEGWMNRRLDGGADRGWIVGNGTRGL